MSDKPVLGIAIPSPLVNGPMTGRFTPGALNPDDPVARTVPIELLLMEDGSVEWKL